RSVSAKACLHRTARARIGRRAPRPEGYGEVHAGRSDASRDEFRSPERHAGRTRPETPLRVPLPHPRARRERDDATVRRNRLTHADERRRPSRVRRRVVVQRLRNVVTVASLMCTHLRRFIVGLFVFALILFAARQATAQNGRASLSGRVADPSGAVLQGAQIIVQPMGLLLQSDAQGEFTVRDLEGGTYHLVVSYVGFQLFEADFAVEPGAVRHVTVQLAVASQSESI